MLRLEIETFDRVARIVWRINPSSQEQHESALHLRDFMIYMADNHMRESNYFSTGGFCLTAYTCPNGDRKVVATLNSYGVEQYLQQDCRIPYLGENTYINVYDPN